MANTGIDPGLNRRILIVDDNPAIHEDFRKILCRSNSSDALDDEEAAIFGRSERADAAVGFELDSALQGQEGLEKVRAACDQQRPYAMAFVDVRMPPGWDGVETVSRIWKICPDLQIVICTAYSDYSWDEMFRQVGQSDSLLILKKPFDNVEVLQMAHAMTRKWVLNQQARDHVGQLNRLVEEKTIELREANDGLIRVNRQMESAVERANRLARDAGAAEQSKDALLSELGRELRGSINATVNLTRHLMETPLDAKQRHHAEAIRSHCESLIDFASKVIDHSKPGSESGEPALCEFDLRELVEQVLHLEQAAARSRGVSLSASYGSPAPGWLVGDSLSFRHVLSKLVGTSVQRAAGSRVEIEVKTERTAPDRTDVRVAVREPGSGVSEVTERIQASSSEATPVGFGSDDLVSLAAMSRLVESFGGKFGSQGLGGKRMAFWIDATFQHRQSSYGGLGLRAVAP